MSPEQAARAAAIHADAFADGGGGRPWSAREIGDICGSPGGFALFAPSDAAPDSFLIGRVAGPEAELITLAVAPDARRQGRARSLLAAFAARVGAAAAEAAFLEVAAGNAPARALYAADGWREAGRRRGYYRRPDGSREDAVVMRRALG